MTKNYRRKPGTKIRLKAKYRRNMQKIEYVAPLVIDREENVSLRKSRAIAVARVMNDVLLAWIKENLMKDMSTTRKVACLIWYDKISDVIASHPLVLEVVRETGFDHKFSKQKVIKALCEVFKYKYRNAQWRLSERMTNT